MLLLRNALVAGATLLLASGATAQTPGQRIVIEQSG
jgi:hypothetical protein